MVEDNDNDMQPHSSWENNQRIRQLWVEINRETIHVAYK